MKVELSDEAKLQAREENAWWRKHRDSKSLFTEELRGARKALRDAPKHQTYAYIDGEPVRRILLEKWKEASGVVRARSGGWRRGP